MKTINVVLFLLLVVYFGPAFADPGVLGETSSRIEASSRRKTRRAAPGRRCWDWWLRRGRTWTLGTTKVRRRSRLRCATRKR